MVDGLGAGRAGAEAVAADAEALPVPDAGRFGAEAGAAPAPAATAAGGASGGAVDELPLDPVRGGHPRELAGVSPVGGVARTPAAVMRQRYRVLSTIAVTLAVSCLPGQDEDVGAAYLAVIRDVSGEHPGKAVCVSTAYSYGESAVDENVMAAVVEAGYPALAPRLWPDTSSMLIALGRMRTDTSGMHTTTHVFITHASEEDDELLMDFDVHSHWLECGDGCEIRGRRPAGTGHGQVPLEDVVSCLRRGNGSPEGH